MKVNKFSRGQIWWLKDDVNYDGSIQGKERLCVIISNNLNNANSSIVTVIPLTTQIKRLDMPTHTTFYVNNTQNMTLCECVKTVNMTKLYDYQGTCDTELLGDIDKCLKIALGLIEIPTWGEHNELSEIDTINPSKKTTPSGRKPLIPIELYAQFIEDSSKLAHLELCKKYNLTIDQMRSQIKRIRKLLSQTKEDSK